MLRDAEMIYDGVLGENYSKDGTSSSLCLGAMISYPLKL